MNADGSRPAPDHAPRRRQLRPVLHARRQADHLLVELQESAQRQLRSLPRQPRRHGPRAGDDARRVRRLPDVQPRRQEARRGPPTATTRTPPRRTSSSRTGCRSGYRQQLAEPLAPRSADRCIGRKVAARRARSADTTVELSRSPNAVPISRIDSDEQLSAEQHADPPRRRDHPRSAGPTSASGETPHSAATASCTACAPVLTAPGWRRVGSARRARAEGERRAVERRHGEQARKVPFQFAHAALALRCEVMRHARRQLHLECSAPWPARSPRDARTPACRVWPRARRGNDRTRRVASAADPSASSLVSSSCRSAAAASPARSASASCAAAWRSSTCTSSMMSSVARGAASASAVGSPFATPCASRRRNSSAVSKRPAPPGPHCRLMRDCVREVRLPQPCCTGERARDCAPRPAPRPPPTRRRTRLRCSGRRRSS